MAAGTNGTAYLLTMFNQQFVDVQNAGGRNHFPKGLLALFRSRGPNKSYPVGYPVNMNVNGYGSFLESIDHNTIGCFPSDPGES